MHSGTLLLHHHGVLCTGPAVWGAEGREESDPQDAGGLGLGHCQRHELPSPAQDHSQGSQVSQVSPLFCWHWKIRLGFCHSQCSVWCYKKINLYLASHNWIELDYNTSVCKQLSWSFCLFFSTVYPLVFLKLCSSWSLNLRETAEQPCPRFLAQSSRNNPSFLLCICQQSSFSEFLKSCLNMRVRPCPV